MEVNQTPGTSKQADMKLESQLNDSTSQSGTVKDSSSSSVNIKLHPLVIMNISDHWTRSKTQQKKNAFVCGALIGKQTGRTIEIMNSFQLDYTVANNKIIIDSNYFFTKEGQFKQVFKDLDFHGWYTTGASPTEGDIEVHRQISEFAECPLFLKLNPLAPSTDLPISMFEPVIDVSGSEAVTRFVPIPYTLATEEAERIGVDHVARVSNVESNTESSASSHLHSQHNSISMLFTRIKLILDYAKQVQDGTLPRDQEIMRSVHALCRRLPELGTEHLTRDLHNQYNDVTLMTYLGVMSKGSQTLNEFISKVNILFDRSGAGRRLRGLIL